MAEKQAVSEQPAFSLQDVMQIVDSMSEKNTAALMAAIKELKKPSPEEQEKLDNEKKLKLRKLQMRQIEASKEEAVRLSRTRNCRHLRRTMQGYSSAWGGQVNSDGYVRFVCNQCQLVAPEVKAPIEWIKNGVNAQDPTNEFMTKLTLEQIVAWHKHFGPKPQPEPVTV